MDWLQAFNIFVFCFAAVAIGTRPLLACLRGRNILDHPNARSSHKTPVPHGGGLVIIPVLVIAWIWIGNASGNDVWLKDILIVSAIAIFIGIISWLDDLRGLSALFRLLVQIAAVSLTLWFAPFQASIFQGFLPPVVDTFMSAVLWLWFINLFNFMDGIDGISGVEVLIIGTGILVLPNTVELTPLAAALCGVAAGFLVWNWHPAKIFLGDVGSAPLGYMLGWLLLWLAANGNWAVALILPGYYLADATITLVRRALRGERIWRAHKEHYYQKPIQKGQSHALVSGVIFATGVVLIGCSYVAASGYGVPALIVAALSIIATLGFFAKN